MPMLPPHRLKSSKLEKIIEFINKNGWEHGPDETYTHGGAYMVYLNKDSEISDVATFLFHNLKIFMSCIKNETRTKEYFTVKVDNIMIYFTIGKDIPAATEKDIMDLL